jgi:hypothetical protein
MVGARRSGQEGEGGAPNGSARRMRHEVMIEAQGVGGKEIL